MAVLVYVLSALASLACTVMLLRGWIRTRERFLLWAGLCFGALVLNNVLLYVDLVIVPEIDLSVARSAVALAGISMLLFGLIWNDVR